MQKTLVELAQIVDGIVIGDETTVISSISKIEEGTPESIAFFTNPQYEKYLRNTKASAVLVPRTIAKANTNLIQVDDSYLAFRKIALLFHPFSQVTRHFVHPGAVIENGVKLEHPVNIGAFAYIGNGSSIGKHTSIGVHTYVGSGVQIGNHTTLHPRVSILDRCIIGNRAIIHTGAVIGSDGFGYAKDKDTYLKIPQMGIVVIDDDAEIGANTTIDRATIGSTYIGIGCKIDNLVQIAHNVVIGDHTVIAAQTGIAGSTKVGPKVTMAGQVGIVGHIEIGENVIIGAQSGVSKSIPPNSFYFGYPARDHRQAKKTEILLRKLPQIYERLKKIEATVNRTIE